MKSAKLSGKVIDDGCGNWAFEIKTCSPYLNNDHLEEDILDGIDEILRRNDLDILKHGEEIEIIINLKSRQ